MNEATIRRQFLLVAKEKFDLFAFPIESGLVAQGIPDTYIQDGQFPIWTEIKYVEDFPKRDDTCVNKTLLRPAQIAWFNKYHERTAFGGWVLVRVKNAYFVFPGAIAEEINSFTQEDYYERCGLCIPAKSFALVTIIKYLRDDLSPEQNWVRETRDSFKSKIPEDMF